MLAQLDVRQLARPLLAELVARAGETATLSVPGAREAITVDFVPSPSCVVSMAWVGRPSVPHATAVGKVMLAFAPGHEADASGPLKRFTERTLTDPAALAAEITAVRDRGYAEAVGEREPDLTAIAAPVFARGGRAGGDPGSAGSVGAAARRDAPHAARAVVGRGGGIGAGARGRWVKAPSSPGCEGLADALDRRARTDARARGELGDAQLLDQPHHVTATTA